MRKDWHGMCFCRCATATSLTCKVSASSIECSGTESTIRPRRNPPSPFGARTTTSTTPNGNSAIRPVVWDTADFSIACSARPTSARPRWPASSRSFALTSGPTRIPSSPIFSTRNSRSRPRSPTSPVSTVGTPIRLTALETLDFRVSAQCKDLPCNTTDSGFNFETNFSIRLVSANGALSDPVPLRDYASLTGPVGGLVRGIGTSPHPILMTARIPLTAFGNASLTSLRGVRFTFDDTRSEDINIGNIRLSRVSGIANSIAISTVLPGSDSPLDLGDSTNNEKNTIESVKATRSSRALANQAGVEIELTSNREFLPKGEMLTLKVGSQEFSLSRFGEDGSTNRVIFTLTAEQWSLLSN